MICLFTEENKNNFVQKNFFFVTDKASFVLDWGLTQIKTTQQQNSNNNNEKTLTSNAAVEAVIKIK